MNRRKLALDSGTVLFGQAGRYGLQALTLVLVARLLGSADYGRASGVMAFLMTVAPMVNLGTTTVMIRRSAADLNQLPRQLAIALAITTSAGLSCSVLVSCGYGLLFAGELPLFAVIALCLSELLLVRIYETLVRVSLIQERAGTIALRRITLPACRLACLTAAWALLGALDIGVWALCYLLGTILALASARGPLRMIRGLPRPHPGELRNGARNGMPFAVAGMAQTVCNEADKYLLLLLSTPVATGAYAAAYRFLDLAFSPIQAVITSSTATLIRLERGDRRRFRRLMGWLTGGALVYGGVLAACALLLSFLLVRLLGPSFATATTVLGFIAPALPILSVRRLLTVGLDVLDGSGQRARIQALAALFNIITCIISIPLIGWRGAALATIATELLLAVVLGRMFLHHSRRAGVNGEQDPPASTDTP